MKIKSYSLIKYSLALVYIWFGLLKVLGVSPVAGLVKDTFTSFPEPMFLTVLGVGEIVIGLLLLSRKTVKLGVFLMWAQIAGIFIGVVLNPILYFSGANLLYLGTYGEFVVKNFVFIAAGYYLWEKN